ncbi:MAG: hypothetical protein AABY07_01215 [Nanoarchaeota archaeon]
MTNDEFNKLHEKAVRLCYFDDMLCGKNSGETAPCGDVILRLTKALGAATLYLSYEEKVEVRKILLEGDFEEDAKGL